MTVRGGGVPPVSMAVNAAVQNGSAASELAADAHPCIMVWVFGPPHTRMWHDASCTNHQLPSNFVIPDTLKCAAVLEAVQGQAPTGWRYALLDRFCARRLHSIVAARSNKETKHAVS
jgi:hypothetical protein